MGRQFRNDQHVPQSGDTAPRPEIPQVNEGKLALYRLLALAEYEIEHDPYRGMLVSKDGESNPWGQCQFVKELNEDESVAARKVFGACHCTCPSLIKWTEMHDLEVSRRRKRKRKSTGMPQYESVLGRRPADPRIRCACDYNPLCLASLGGVMDEVLERAAQLAQAKESQDEVIRLDGDSEAAEDSSTAKPPKEKRGKTIAENIVEGNLSDEPTGVVEDEETNAQQLELNPSKDDAIYSPLTSEQIQQVRKTIEIDIGPIHSYVEKTILASLENGVSISLIGYMDKLRKWHDSISFSNPLTTTIPSHDKMRITVPPGIKNLGATCYLNTQFQCLRGMTAFLDGIFSWSPLKDNHQMNSVLSSMQVLFARMVHGAESTLTTQDFSSALGLENDEMQDPNEFARLLFERMHESFQQCSDKNLQQLLPRLFHGVTTYETTCLTCLNKTERNEGFMDLTLPIVHPSSDSSRKSGQMSIADAFAGAADTNVQYCLDRYICAEELSGDNKYWCEACQAKRDARRAIQLQQLPPILNVQLSRYVFDRKKLVKKKLTDKVLLPLVLKAPMKGEIVDSKYMLCAVMRHHGTSAYQGHYVAEAMDWQSGKWFEFNDEKVNVLDGPGCSYAPEAFDTEQVKKTAKGSQDAYNMYYVEEAFLAKCATGFLCSQGEQEAMNKAGVLSKVAKEREQRYSMLAEMCLNDGKIACRLMQRRAGISNTLSTLLSSPTGGIAFLEQARVSTDGAFQNETMPSVWVDGEMLRRFLSCDKADRGSIVSSSGPFLKHKHLLCEHQTGLHPRVARRGKLLPRPIYDAYVSLLLGERRAFYGESLENAQEIQQCDDNDVNDCIITQHCNMYCEKCADSYKDEMRLKIETLERLVHLYEEFEPKSKSALLISLEASDDGSAEDEGVGDNCDYLVSSKFATKFRSRISSLLKGVVVSEMQSELMENGSGTDANCVGLDTLDLSAFDLQAVTSLSKSSKDDLDCYVNSNITCKHGNFNESNNRFIRRISEESWDKLNFVFPNAICHKLKKNVAPQDARCERCIQDESTEESFTEKLLLWFSSTSSGVQGIVKGRRSISDLECELLLDTDTDDGSPHRKSVGSADDLYLVHHEDLVAWRKALRAVKALCGKTNATVTERLIELLFSRESGRDDSGDPREDRTTEPHIKRPQLVSYRGWCPQPLFCGSHGLPAHDAIFDDSLTLTKPSDPCIMHLSRVVEPLLYSEYAGFVRSIFDLGMILFPSGNGHEDYQYGNEASPQSLTALLQALQRTHHPRLVSPVSSLGLHSTSSLEAITPSDVAQRLSTHFAEGVCRDSNCNEIFASQRLQAATSSSKSGIENVVDLVDETVDDCVGANGEAPATSARYSLRVFEFESSAVDETAVSNILGLPRSGVTVDSSDPTAVRRSSRKRKLLKGNCGVLREDSVQLGSHHNLAALRLFLYEQDPSFRLDQTLTVIIPSTVPEGNDNHIDTTGNFEVVGASSNLQYSSFQLPFAWNEKSLGEAILLAQGNISPEKESLKTSMLSQIFLYRKQDDATDTKKNGNSDALPTETLLDALLELSNASSPDDGEGPDKPPDKDKNKSTRRAERGFRGTLLHSSVPKAVETTDANSVDETKRDTKADRMVEKQPALDTVEKDAKERLKVDVLGPADKLDLTFVVLDDDESDDETPAATEQSHALTPSNNSNQSLDDNLSVLVSSTSVGLEAPMSNSRRSLRSDVDDPRGQEAASKLLEIVSNGKGSTELVKSRCRSAVRWAMAMNSSDTNMSELVSAAYAKFLSDQP